MKKIYLGLCAGLVTALIGIGSVDAAKMSIVGSDNAIVDNNITLNVEISELEGESIIGIGGQISFDKEYLELVSMKGIEEPYSVDYNLKNAKFAGVSFSGRGILEDKKVLAITFKAKKEGNTTVDFADYELTNVKTDLVDTTSVSKEIVIKEALKEEAPKVVTTGEKKEDKKPTYKSTTVSTSNSNSDNKIEEKVNNENTIKGDNSKEVQTSSKKEIAKVEVKKEVKEVKQEKKKEDIKEVDLTSFIAKFKALFVKSDRVVNDNNSNNFFNVISKKIITIFKRA